MKIKNLILTGLAALMLVSTAACTGGVVVHSRPVVYASTGPAYYDTYDYDEYGYAPYSWQWYYVRRHHHRPYEGHGGYRNYDQRGGFHHR